MSNRKKVVISLSLILTGIVLTLLSRYIDGFADGYYTYIYRYLSVPFAFIFNLLPFSVAEAILYLVCLLFFGSIGYGVYVIFKKKGYRKDYWLSFANNIFLTIASVFLLYIIFCGINYQKTSFAEAEGFSEDKYGVEELKDVCEDLTDRINTLGEMEFTYTDIRESAREAVRKLSKSYPTLSGYYPKPKWLLIPEILSYQQVSGVYAFYTVEANYNSDMPIYQQPYTMCHELAHLKGIMREEEANFVAYLACENSDQLAMQYSSAMFGYTYCMNELYKYDVEAFYTIRAKLCEKANKDIEEKHAFWDQYKGAISDLQTKVNDAYLKANSQSSGVFSYNEVVALIVNYNLNKDYKD